jgi:hypothetical protein
MPDLRTRAATAAAPAGAADAPASRDPIYAPDAGAPATLEPVDAPEGISTDPDAVPVQVAIARAMRDLGIIAKADRFDGGNAGKYNFRGVDRVVNACAPVLRKHGLIVIPTVQTIEYRDIQRAGGGRSHECVVTMAYAWVGPRGDEKVSVTAGEALDTADKATSKAQSVAWRTCLIQMLAIPTGDPDPDSQRIERGDQPTVSATAYRDEIVDPRTSLGRLKQIRAELGQHGLRAVLVMDDHGDEAALGDLVDRIGRERSNTTR